MSEIDVAHLREALREEREHIARQDAEIARLRGALQMLCDDIAFDEYAGMDVADYMPDDRDDAYDVARVECVLRAYDAALRGEEGT